MVNKRKLPLDLVVLVSLLLASAACDFGKPTATATSTPTPLATPTQSETAQPTATITPAQATPIRFFHWDPQRGCFRSRCPEEPLSPATMPTPTDDFRVFVWPEETAVAPGDDLQVSIWVSPGSTGISGGEIRVAFPSEVFEALDIQAGTLLGADPLVGYSEINNSDGVTRLAIARVGPTDVPSQQGVFAILSLKCRASAPAGQYSLDLSAGLANQRFEDITIGPAQRGLVTVRVP